MNWSDLQRGDAQIGDGSRAFDAGLRAVSDDAGDRHSLRDALLSR